MKVLGKELYNNENIEMYNRVIQDIKDIADEIEEGNGILSRCQWHEKGEKPS